MDIIISDQLTPIELHIENIYLDPNNPRFVDDNWKTILDDKIDQENVQRDARDKMEKFHDVDKLRMNMEINGYLPIDRIIVRPFNNGKYVVLEGNRRITAAKQILELHHKGIGVDDAVLKSLESIPCLEYTGSDNEAAWIFQGIRHITGISDWSAYNKAKLLTERFEEEGMKLTEVGKQFGLTAYGAGRWVRAYKAFRQAKDDSDYNSVIDEKEVYRYFQELFGPSNIPLRQWLEWKDFRFENTSNLNEFLSWLYPKEDSEDETDIDDDTPGEWDKRKVSTVQRLRDISYLLKNDEQRFEQFRGGGNLDTIVASAKVEKAEEQLEIKRQPAKKLLQSMDDLIKRLGDIPTLRFKNNDELKGELLDKLDLLQNAVNDVKNAFSD